MTGNGVWFVAAESGAADNASLTRWRDDIAGMATGSLPGVRRVERYAAFNVPRIAVVVDLDTALTAAPPLAPHPAISCTSLLATKRSEFVQDGEADPVGAAPILYSVLFQVPPDWHAEFDAWYDQEHVPMILGCKEWAMTVRYHVHASAWTHLALHYIKSASAFDAPALKAARLTPWRNKLLAHRWFTDVDKMIHFRQT